MKHRRSTRRPPAQLSIALDANGAGDVGARSGGTEPDDASPTSPPSVAAPEAWILESPEN
jgi:hypothetical protein